MNTTCFDRMPKNRKPIKFELETPQNLKDLIRIQTLVLVSIRKDDTDIAKWQKTGVRKTLP